MQAPLLVLFDIDGTLLLDDAYAHGRAMVHAMRDVYRVALPDDAVERVGPWGKTDLRIAREALRTAGLSDEQVEARRGAWIDAAARAFVAEVRATSDRWHVRPGIAEAVKKLDADGFRLTLLTGNLRPIAAAKVARMGMAGAFDIAAGAYGNDAEDRTTLVPIARRRAGADAGPWPRAGTAVVGDTPADVATAQADGVASIVFCSPRYPRQSLAHADLVVEDTEELVAALQARGRGDAASGASDLVAEHEPEQAE